MTTHTEHQTQRGLMDQPNNRAQTQAHDGGRLGPRGYLIENRVRDRRAFWLALLAGVALLLAWVALFVYGVPFLVGMEL